MAIIDKISGFGDLAYVTQSFDDVAKKFIRVQAVNKSALNLRIFILSPIVWNRVIKSGENFDYSIPALSKPTYSILTINKGSGRFVDTFVGYEIKFTLGN